MSEKTFKSVMGELAEAFVEDTRGDGSKFVRLVDGRPEWMRDAVYAAHDGSLPDDWTYRACMEMALGLTEYDLDAEDDVLGELVTGLADRNVDVYTHDLLRWLYTVGADAIAAVDDARADGWFEGSAGLEEQLRIGQLRMYERIGNALVDAVREQVEAEREAEVAK